VKLILQFLRRCSRFATVDTMTQITVFSLPQNDAKIDEHRPKCAAPYQQGVSAKGKLTSLIVEVREDGSAFVWTAIPYEIGTIVQTGVVYRLHQSVEIFAIAGADVVVDKVVEGAVSQFFINYFSSLTEALLAYRDTMARTSKCHLLRLAWAHENRIWFSTKPEFRLRRSLCNFLYASLRYDDIDLRPEQNVDESHPVDIKIIWRMDRRTAIIEVKWIGKSIDSASKKVTANYSDVRARSGARQLAKYLEAHRQEAPQEDTRGYLVVFDCRRHRVKPADTDVETIKGMYYANREIVFNPQYHKTRNDFDEPIRIFLEPICV